LKERPRRRARVLIFVGQSFDEGSETRLATLRDEVERENVGVYVLALPEAGKDFVYDTFSLRGLTRDRGGYRAGIDLGRLVPVLSRSAAVEAATDPFSVLTAAT